jgi:SAM-dependent methyltransferase
MHKFNIKNIEKLDNPERRRTMPPEETLEKFNIKDDGVLLDVGCGIGYFTIPAAKLLKDNKAIGIDIMPEILEIAREKTEALSNIEFKVSKEYSFPVEDKSVKYVLISNCLQPILSVNNCGSNSSCIDTKQKSTRKRIPRKIPELIICIKYIYLIKTDIDKKGYRLYERYPLNYLTAISVTFLSVT